MHPKRDLFFRIRMGFFINGVDPTRTLGIDLATRAASGTSGNKKEASERIKQAFATKAFSLDLSKLALEDIPKCIGQLHDLHVLRLSLNQLESLPDELGNLSKLDFLCLSYNKKFLT